MYGWGEVVLQVRELIGTRLSLLAVTAYLRVHVQILIEKPQKDSRKEDT